ncbi:unnamed protein product [Paramecium octaurelia]|uniref:Uncharacterized protein n=1 Tax=Paramecium octaurelia TaxID=43137 RepID=A0A8S1W8D3_PAROT|nr:unnamed protein product [Paramecium octaurelia]
MLFWVDGYVYSNKYGCKYFEGIQHYFFTLKANINQTKSSINIDYAINMIQVGFENLLIEKVIRKQMEILITQVRFDSKLVKPIEYLVLIFLFHLHQWKGSLIAALPGSKFKAFAARRCQEEGSAKTDEDCKKFMECCLATGKGSVDKKYPC